MDWLARLQEMLGHADVLVLFAAMVWAAVLCFLGYVLFRVNLVIAGVLLGGIIGYLVLSIHRPQAPGRDYFVLCTALAALLGLGGWFLYRLAFALYVASAVAVAGAFLLGRFESVGGWIVGAVVGIPLGVLAFVYVRQIVIFATGLAGGVGAVFNALAMIVGGLENVGALFRGPRRAVGLLMALAAVGIGLAAVGMYVQSRLAGIFRQTFMPQGAYGRRKKKRRHTAYGAFPPFAKP